ncbi:heparan-alpha-glucosaminide N-acetyltransferase domain-containing protein [Herbiconiux sp. CPCC 203407]|uniref:Heparan-alpha-glucosaminide N-acetyltransferase domain-containing protein n=1 Tax=Herbiconiux oxytropis TaxID=2970915 RepID=A0AA41XGG7_9MICO|nr:heparan-alpha-glucosaminide N-acetyltransferase domain-containing protein [Herbiconiux oxytropis]MCS5722965.1 heparan-alpha-glucosaminide N-acetyltransferase domain-containing protein [Herbiconiux oxytropis]MCS5725223.1 heparan-alpha-glucosaminide N-acetyltransferase domain-containing protein [Herbiconiux oxytropis]
MTSGHAGIPGRERILGLDLARFVAIAGMMATHTWLWADSVAGVHVASSEQFQGRASALFAVLAGVGAVLATRAPIRERRPGAARLMLVGRGVALVAIGLTLTLLDIPIFVILAYYGVLFWFLALAVTWPRWVLVSVGAVVAVAAPVAVYLLGEAFQLTEREASNPNWLSLADPLLVLRGLLVTGTYPVLIWIAYGLVGMAIGRTLLAARGSTASAASTGGATALRVVAAKLAAVGAVVWLGGIALAALAHGPLGAVRGLATELGVSEKEALGLLTDPGAGRPVLGSPWMLAASAAHTGTTFDLILTIGSSTTVIGLLVLLGTVLGPLARRILSPVLGAGAAPLTVYSAHVLLVGTVTLVMLGKPYGELTWQEYVVLDTPWFLSSWGFWLANILMALLIGSFLTFLGRRGPLETLVTWAGRLAARLAHRPARADARGSAALSE